jgi:hypothetical protein
VQRLARLPRDDWKAQLSDCAKSLDIEQGELVKRVEAEHKALVLAEARRLAGLSEVDWKYQVGHGSAERLGIEPRGLEQLVKAEIKTREKAAKKAADDDDRKEKKRVAAERAEQKKRDDEQKQIDKAAKDKEKTKAKALADIAKLPMAQYETKLVQLATKLDLDLPALRAELAALIEEDKEASEPSLWDVEPWPQPVSTAEVLSALVDKYAKHIAAELYEIVTLALWAMMTWVYQDAARHSTFLVLTSADPEAGKTTTLEVLNFTVLRPSLDTEITGPTLFRFIDQAKPTMLNDEAEDAMKRREIRAITLKSHLREGTIKRQERVQGRYVTVQFSPWCPKAFALVGLNVPPALISRSIVIQLWPKLPGSKVKFDHVDDEEFAGLRRKLSRWAHDHVSTLKGKEPLFSAGLDNRLADLWWLLLAIAETAGGDWPQQARTAAERLSRSRPTPSWRRLLLQTIARMAADGRTYVLSEELHTEVLRDPTSPFHEYENKRGRVGKITQRQIAHLLGDLGIHPTLCGPQRLSGYLIFDCGKAFTHYRILSSSPAKKRRLKKQRSKARA